MKVIGVAKLTSKKGVHMAKVQVERAYLPDEIARLELAAGKCIDDLWLYDPLLNKVDASTVGKDIEPVYTHMGGRPVITDVIIK